MQNEKIEWRESEKREKRNRQETNMTMEKLLKNDGNDRRMYGVQKRKMVINFQRMSPHTKITACTQDENQCKQHTNFIMENDYCKTGLNMLATEIQSRKSNWTIYTKSTPEFW